MSAEAFSALGQMLLVVCGVGAALWAIYNYQRNRRAEAARWVKDLHTEFYTEPDLLRGRELFEYDYEKELRYLFEIRVTDRDIELDDRLRENLRLADRVLNFFEQIEYLQDEAHIDDDDKKVFFEYWFDTLSDPVKSGLHRYLARCGYERLSRALGLPADDYIAFYGTLMSQYDNLDRLGVRQMLELDGECQVPGYLLDLGEWPGAVRDGDQHFTAELWKVRDRKVFQALDPFERYNPRSPETSHYQRRTVHTWGKPDLDVWVYYLRDPAALGPSQAKAIPSGDWRLHVAELDQPTIRRARPDDVIAVHELVASLDPLTEHTRYTYWVLFSYSPSRCFVAEHQDRMVGFVTGFLSDIEPPTLLVWQVGVHPEFRGTGLADRLLDRVVEIGRQTGAVGIETTIADDNPFSHKAFTRLADRLGSKLQSLDMVTLPSITDGQADVETRYQIPTTGRP